MVTEEEPKIRVIVRVVPDEGGITTYKIYSEGSYIAKEFCRSILDQVKRFKSLERK